MKFDPVMPNEPSDGVSATRQPLDESCSYDQLNAKQGSASQHVRFNVAIASRAELRWMVQGINREGNAFRKRIGGFCGESIFALASVQERCNQKPPLTRHGQRARAR